MTRLIIHLHNPLLHKSKIIIDSLVFLVDIRRLLQGRNLWQTIRFKHLRGDTAFLSLVVRLLVRCLFTLYVCRFFVRSACVPLRFCTPAQFVRSLYRSFFHVYVCRSSVVLHVLVIWFPFLGSLRFLYGLLLRTHTFAYVSCYILSFGYHHHLYPTVTTTTFHSFILTLFTYVPVYILYLLLRSFIAVHYVMVRWFVTTFTVIIYFTTPQHTLLPLFTTFILRSFAFCHFTRTLYTLRLRIAVYCLLRACRARAFLHAFVPWFRFVLHYVPPPHRIRILLCRATGILHHGYLYCLAVLYAGSLRSSPPYTFSQFLPATLVCCLLFICVTFLRSYATTLYFTFTRVLTFFQFTFTGLLRARTLRSPLRIRRVLRFLPFYIATTTRGSRRTAAFTFVFGSYLLQLLPGLFTFPTVTVLYLVLLLRSTTSTFYPVRFLPADGSYTTTITSYVIRYTTHTHTAAVMYCAVTARTRTFYMHYIRSLYALYRVPCYGSRFVLPRCRSAHAPFITPHHTARLFTFGYHTTRVYVPFYLWFGYRVHTHTFVTFLRLFTFTTHYYTFAPLSRTLLPLRTPHTDIYWFLLPRCLTCLTFHRQFVHSLLRYLLFYLHSHVLPPPVPFYVPVLL